MQRDMPLSARPRLRIALAYRWELVFWLWLAYLFNQADRQVFAVVLPQLRADLHLSVLQAGMVASLFTIALALAVPIAGYCGDVISRRSIILVSLLAWSVATLLTGFSWGFLYLVLVRSLATAVGEGFFAPSAYALIGEHHRETRAQAMSIHQTGLYVGIVMSGLVAGYLADRYSWRVAFWIFGAIGVLLAAAMRGRLRESRSGPNVDPPSVRLVLVTLMRTPTAILLAFALSCVVFVSVGYLTWMPSYLHERFHLSLTRAGFSSMFYHHLFAFLGVLTGGWLSDRLARKRPRSRLELQCTGLMVAIPFLYLLGSASQLPVVYLALAGFGFFRGIYDSNVYAALFQLIEPRLHASASGAVICVAYAIGSLAPLALAAIKQVVGLSVGLSALSLVYLLGTASILWGAFAFFAVDSARARMETNDT